jgi:hypothetical protein
MNSYSKIECIARSQIQCLTKLIHTRRNVSHLWRGKGKGMLMMIIIIPFLRRVILWIKNCRRNIYLYSFYFHSRSLYLNRFYFTNIHQLLLTATLSYCSFPNIPKSLFPMRGFLVYLQNSGNTFLKVWCTRGLYSLYQQPAIFVCLFFR